MVDQISNNQGSNRIYGVLPGEVTDVSDPEGMGRILVRFHSLASEENSYWARIATLYSGNDRGILFRQLEKHVLQSATDGFGAFTKLIYSARCYLTPSLDDTDPMA